MVIDLNLSVCGELDSCTNQVIAIAKHTNTKEPVVQSTTTRELGESDESFICRLRCNIRGLIASYGYAHHVTLLCRNVRGCDALTKDKYQNNVRNLRYISNNSRNHAERVKALSLLFDMHSVLTESKNA